MKRQLTTSLLLLFICGSHLSFSQVRPAKLTSAADMRGAYMMLKQEADSGTGAFALNTHQMKIFTDKYAMYAHRRSETDSMADFGIGTYKVENGKVTEHMFFGSWGAGDDTYELAIDKRNDGYSQVIHFPANNRGVSMLLTEDYAKASKKMSSPLDGAWSLKKLIITDKDGKTKTYNSDENAKQFKLYESGNFMWANYVKDMQANNVSTAYGYGSFTMDKPNEITEVNVSSTYATSLVGKPYRFQIKLIGTDMYEQTSVETNGKRTEVYERMH